MRNIVNTSLWKVDAFDTPAYVQEVNLIKVVVKDVNYPEEIQLECGSIAATYYTSTPNDDVEGFLTIDVTELLQLHPQDDIVLTYVSEEVIATISWTEGGLINPHHLAIPINAESEDIEAVGLDGVVLPPSTILQDFGIPSAVEFQGSMGGDITFTARTQTVGHVAQSTTMPVGCKKFVAQYDGEQGSAFVVRNMKPLQCGKIYAAVQWVSRCGAVKRATWEVAKIAGTTDSSTALMELSNGYHILKAHTQGFTLKLDNLNPYDFWYYADICTSSDVRVALHTTEYANDTIIEDNRVLVNTESYVVADGNTTAALEIDVTFKHYATL